MMQRIISLQMTRDADRSGSSSEFVSKRLCCSLLFTVAFLSLLGGFLLGRYATDRALILKNAILQHKQQDVEKNSIEVMNNISSSVNYINNVTRHLPRETFDHYEFYERLKCLNHTANIARYEKNLERLFALNISKVLNEHLEVLSACFYSIRRYLEHYVVNPTVTSD